MGREMDKTFEILMREHHRRVMAYALSLVRDEATAKDLVQDAFVVAYQRLPAFDVSRDFGNWVRGIVRLKYLEWCRERKEVFLSDEILDRVGDQYQEWDAASRDGRGESFDKLRDCMGGLEGLARQAVTLFYIERKPCREIASLMQTTEVAVRKRIERIRKELLDCVRRSLNTEANSLTIR